MEIDTVKLQSEDGTFEQIAKAFSLSFQSRLVVANKNEENAALKPMAGDFVYQWASPEAELSMDMSLTIDAEHYEDILKGVGGAVVIGHNGGHWYDLKYQVVCAVRDPSFDKSTGTYSWKTIEKVDFVDLTDRRWLARLVRWVLRIKG